MNVYLLRHTADPEKLVAQAAKLCYSDASMPELQQTIESQDIQRFIKMLTDIGHESTMEHASFTFGVEGISRITEIQLVRKRIASYSVKSGRYVKRDNPPFIIPTAIQESPEALEEFDKARLASITAYNKIFIILVLKGMGYSDEIIKGMSEDARIRLIEEFKASDKREYSRLEKEAIEDARYVHMQSLSTSLIVTMNASSLRGFFKARCCRRAQWEIREMANLMLKEVRAVAPNLFYNAGPGCVRGKCPEGKMSCGRPFPLVK